MPRRLPVVLVSLALAVPLLSLPPAASAAPTPAKPYDFNGDGLADLAAGAAFLRVGTEVAAGGVVVLPGSSSGLSLQEQVVGTPGGAKEESVFGTALTSADFDRDGFADLAVGAPGEFGRYQPSGAVHVLYGSKAGLTGARAQRLTQVGGEDFDAGFGSALTTGDFDGDGWPELVVSAPGTTEQTTTPANGVLSVYRGGPAGFSPARGSLLRGDRSSTRYDVSFGTVLAVGDLDGDRRPDLVVGSSAPGDDGAGSISSCPGSANGLTGCTQLARDSALLGPTALAVGNVLGDAQPEIVVGVPRARQDREDGGTVQILALPGPAQGGLVRYELTQDTRGVPGSDEDGDQFGRSVALGALDNDRYADLVVGAPGEDVGSKKDAGRVTVLYGSENLTYRSEGGRIYDRGTKGVPGSAGKGDSFGEQVSLVDHDGDGHLDLTVSAPYDGDGGALTTLEGVGEAFSTTGARTFTLATLGYPTPAGAHLGEALGG